jgi:hypothetical protein
MSDEELKAAAELWRFDKTAKSAAYMLADAMCARIEADAAERAEREKPIDEEWLLSIGFRLHATIEHQTYIGDGVFNCLLMVSRTGTGFYIHGTRVCSDLPRPNTRGQLLDLLRALGITTKEQP